MNWTHADENSLQYQSDRLPTPLSTPRYANDGHTLLRTPRSEVEPRPPDQAHWSPYTSQDGSAVWQTASARPRAGPAYKDPETINVELAHHTYHLSPNPNLQLPPVEPSRQLTSSPGLGTPADTSQGCSPLPKLDQKTPASVGTIQTPPPSETHQRQALGFGQPSPIMADPQRLSNGHRPVMGPPETPSRIMQASPHLFPTLQFSPDLYHFQAPGPASAPVFPQQRLFWDPSSHASDDSTPRPYQDPFAHSQNGLINSFTPNLTIQEGLHPGLSLPEDQPYDLPATSRDGSGQGAAYSYFEGATFPAPFTTSPRAPPPRSEDPSLFLSSPARRFGGPEPSSSFNQAREKPAYHHQIEESKREREFERARKAKAKRASAIFPLTNPSRRPASPAHEARPGLKRSFTDSGVGPRQPHLRNQSHVSFADSVASSGNHSSRSTRGGRSSPLKSALNNTSLGGSLSRNRTSLTIAIDEDGRAKTIVTKVSDPLDTYMDLDGPSSSEDESVDDSDFHILHSQQNSFAFADQDDFALSSRHAQLSIGSHSKNSSYSSTMASTNSAHHSSRTSSSNSGAKLRISKGDAQYSRTLPARTSQQSRNAGRSDLDVLDEANAEFEENTEKGDAQHALRAILRDRPRSRSTHDNSIANRRAASFAHFHSSPPVHHGTFAPFNGSPTTITDPDVATPSTDRGSFISNGSTRCVCNSSSPDGNMIQCESCSKWLHMNCIGIGGQIPEVYICTYCSQTPMRHGRIREPLRASAPAPASPLAHKSQRFR